ncbi:hypothetical protein BPA01_16240 [Brevibacillus parabrevis]|uniref:Uncharacterized protein n=1 Tax=Brevibacillus parabrevis TaxID=54914 RepID=A0A4Y3PEX5_BREPA|nr:hypothetical protein BPA01_16240 [Brevibacillus parabrevis]
MSKESASTAMPGSMEGGSLLMLHRSTIGSVFVASVGVAEGCEVWPAGWEGVEELEQPVITPKSKVRQVASAMPFFM